jgi:hypothetical protein
VFAGWPSGIPLTSHVVTGSPNRLPSGDHAIRHTRVLCVQTAGFVAGTGRRR